MEPIFDTRMNNITELVNKQFAENFCVFANGTKINFDRNEPNKLIINLNDISRCSHCNKQVEPKIIKKGIKKTIIQDQSEDNMLLECEIITTHKECEKLQEKLKKIKSKLLDTEWTIFCKRENE